MTFARRRRESIGCKTGRMSKVAGGGRVLRDVVEVVVATMGVGGLVAAGMMAS